MSHHVAPFAVGFLLLALGAVLLGGGVGQLARRFGVSPWAIGLSVVPLAVAAPVLAVTATAVLHDRHRFAVGIIVGSNIVNIGLALGTAALFRPLAGSSRVVSESIAALLVAVLLFWFVCRETPVSRLDGCMLLVGFVVAVAYLVWTARDEPEEVKAKFAGWAFQRRPVWLTASATAIGIALLVGGALILLPAATRITDKDLKVPTALFGLTAGALALSLALLWVTETAARNGHGDLVFATVVGANLCNLLLVPGITAAIAPFGVTERALMHGIPAMALVTFMLLVPFLNGLRLSRWEGAILLVAYTAFVTWQIRSATR